MFYRPNNAVAADVIPFYRDGKFYLFYLKDYRDISKCGEGTPWHLLKTSNFIELEEVGEVISRGGMDEQDLYIFTGCVFEKDKEGYIFYTGHNPHFMEQGKPQEAVMLARSKDFIHWEKQSDFQLFANENFEPHDFRDPFVFFNPETNEYNMLLAARLKIGPVQRRGCTAVATSKDLLCWTLQNEPFYYPAHYFTHECPDLFQMGEWWYLLFSEFNEHVATRYRMSKSLKGPWLTPIDDCFDNHAFYAAKTAADESHRYIFGWNPTQVDDRDYQHWMWGGNIVVHEIGQNPDGTLFVFAPKAIKEQYNKMHPLQSSTIIGRAEANKDAITLGRRDGYSMISLGMLPEKCRISFDACLDAEVKDFTVFLHSDNEFETMYHIKVDTDAKRLTFDKWPRVQACVSHMCELERKIELPQSTIVHFDIFIEEHVVTVYYNNRVAMNARMNEYIKGHFGLTCAYGCVSISNFCCLTK